MNPQFKVQQLLKLLGDADQGWVQDLGLGARGNGLGSGLRLRVSLGLDLGARGLGLDAPQLGIYVQWPSFSTELCCVAALRF